MKSFHPVLVALSCVLLAVAAAGLPAPTTSGDRQHEDVPGPVEPDNQVSTVSPTASSVSSIAGALFIDGTHYCTASVVDSPGGNLVLTAAHCIHNGESGYRTGISFVPGYHEGAAPYGVWTATRLFVDPRWAADSDPDLDFGFLTVYQTGNPSSLESETGANRLGTDRGFANLVTLSGYPDDSETPVVCQDTTTREDTYQTRIDCPGFPDGTSGGPWVIGAGARGGGTVVGVIGGYQEGGDTADVSYSSYFDQDIATLYKTAIKG
ncbi:MAG TPA: trypsin-like peptidase domain-containing protein [Amycolatopsis sp.]|uniref:trypsin-like serine peptidase n=1 Tax=Amycolatopsis sp. TaxID=37632 RepID=UPI002B46EA49|nr:trypsin-like peptidase domain-containing protein [Amycolatopsis sp.]HKS47352.1 trypsin-like peptidase domain-containing protein [Amycolatopsis sp.]